MDTRNRALFFSRLAVLLESGLGLDRALELCANQAGPGDREAVLKLRAAVAEGRGLGAAAAEQPDRFSALEAGALSAAGDNLPATVRALAVALERDHARRTAARPAGIYLIILVAVGLIVLIVLRLTIVSLIIELVGVFALPQFTTLAMSFSTFTMVALALYLAALVLLKWVAPGLRDSLLAALPGLDRAETMGDSAAFARSLALLLETGAAVPRAVALASSAVGNGTVRAGLAAQEAALSEGGRLGETLGRVRGLHPLVADLAALGESGGRPATALTEAAAELESIIAGSGRLALNVTHWIALAAVVLALAVMIFGIYVPIFFWPKMFS